MIFSEYIGIYRLLKNWRFCFMGVGVLGFLHCTLQKMLTKLLKAPVKQTLAHLAELVF